MLKNIFDFNKLKEQAEELRKELKKEVVRSESGGGMVIAKFNGLGELIDINIDVKLIQEKDKELIEDLIEAVLNRGREKVKERWQEKMKSYMGDVPFSGFGDIIA